MIYDEALDGVAGEVDGLGGLRAGGDSARDDGLAFGVGEGFGRVTLVPTYDCLCRERWGDHGGVDGGDGGGGVEVHFRSFYLSDLWMFFCLLFAFGLCRGLMV